MKELLIAAFLLTPGAVAADKAQPRAGNAWEPQAAREAGGVLGERLKLWREKRLPRVAADPSFVEPFEGGPGSHAWKVSGDGRSGQGESPGSSPLWQGEHIGKWLHAASLAYEQTHDQKLLGALARKRAPARCGPAGERLPGNLRARRSASTRLRTPTPGVRGTSGRSVTTSTGCWPTRGFTPIRRWSAPRPGSATCCWIRMGRGSAT